MDQINTKVDISVVVPVCQNDICDVADDLSMQSLQNIEFLFVAGTGEYIQTREKLAQKDKRFQLIAANADGLDALCKRAVEIAKGEYLAFITRKVHIPADYYHDLYGEAKRQRECDILKARKNTIYPDGRVVRSSLNVTIAKGLQEGKPLNELLESEWETVLFARSLAQKACDSYAAGNEENGAEGNILQLMVNFARKSGHAFAHSVVCEEIVHPVPEGTKHTELEEVSGDASEVNVTCIIDNKDAIPAIVMLSSLKANKHPGTKVIVHLIMHNVDAHWIDNLINLNASDFLLKFYEQNIISYLESGITRSKDISFQELLLFDLGNILSDLKKVLYLSCENVIRKDLTQLYNLNLQKAYIAGVRELGKEGTMKLQEQFGSDLFVDRGVLLMNLELMRRDSIADKLLECLKQKHTEWKSLIDSVINCVMRDNIVALHVRYNAKIAMLASKALAEVNSFYDTSYSCMEELSEDAVIVQYSSADKNAPWQISNAVCGDLWQKYYNLSPIENVQFQKSLQISPKVAVNAKQVVDNIRKSYNELTYNLHLDWLRKEYRRCRILALFKFGKEKRELIRRKQELKKYIKQAEAARDKSLERLLNSIDKPKIKTPSTGAKKTNHKKKPEKMKLFGKEKDKERFNLFGVPVYQKRTKANEQRVYIMGVRVKKKSIKSANLISNTRYLEEVVFKRYTAEQKMHMSELKIATLALHYQHLPKAEKYILCFDCLRDSQIEAIDAWTLFCYLQAKGIKSKYVLMKDNPLHEKLQQENRLKDVIIVTDEAHFIHSNIDIIARSRLVFSSFGFARSKIFSNMPFLKHVYIGHGVALLKKWCSSLYAENGFLECNEIVAATQATKRFYDDYKLWQNKMICCGLPRWDNLKPVTNSNNEKIMFIFFTWRSSFKNNVVQMTEYLKKIQEFVSAVNELIVYHPNVKIYMGLHHSLMRYNKKYDFNRFKNVHLVPATEISSMIKVADLFVTDYSSVCFDFMYRDVPTIFYRFDMDVKYTDEHDNESKVSAAEEDPIMYNCLYDLDSAVNKVKYYFENGCKLEEENIAKNNNIFWPRGANCERLMQLVDAES